MVLGDAHLGAAPEGVEQSLLAALDIAGRDARSVLITGDLFDFWFEWRHAAPRRGFRTLAALARLVERNVPVLWIAGNHDCWGGDVLRRDVGVAYHVGAWRGRIGAWETLVEHGDGLREVEDRPYRRLRSVLRNPLAIWAYRHLLHPDWATWLALRTSHTSRNMRPRDGGEGLRRVAEARLAEQASLDLYVYAHSHVEVVERVESGAVFANAGAWLDRPCGLWVTDRTIALARFEGGLITERQRVARRDSR